MIATLALCAFGLGVGPLAPPAAIIPHAALCAAMLHATPSAADSPKSQPKIELVSVERSIVENTNAERKRYGLPPLQVDEGLMQSAREHTRWMSRNHALRHTSAAVAENIAMGQQDSRQALASWMGSWGHRANILNPAHRRIGVAAGQSPNGTMFWCQQFRH